MKLSETFTTILKKYLAPAKINFKKYFIFRIDYLLNYFSAIIMIFIQYFIWKIIFCENHSINGFNFVDIIKYLITIWAIYGFINTQSISYSIQNKIINGDISYDLLLPVKISLYYFFDYFSQKIINLFLIGIPVYFVSSLYFKVPFSNIRYLILFFISLFLSFIITYNISLFIGYLSILFKNVEGFIQLERFLKIIFSGALVPLVFLPNWINKIISLLPYKYINYIPTMILLEKFSYFDVLKNIVYQLIWATILSSIMIIFISRVRKKLIIFGG